MTTTNNLTFLLNHLAAVMTKQSDHVLQQQFNIGLSQYRILMALEWNPRVQQRAIAESLGQTEASVSRQIKLLTKRGLLVSRPDQGNRRKHITTPTPLGMQITEAAATSLRQSFSPDFNALDDDQLQQLTAGLQQLHRKVCRPGKPGACDHQLGF